MTQRVDSKDHDPKKRVINAGSNALIKPGNVIFVTGSCSSGKSSISTIVAQKMNASYCAFDEFVMPLVLKKFIEKQYGKVLGFIITKLLMGNFFSLVGLLSDKQKYAFQKKFYDELKGGIAQEPTRKMYREVRKVAQAGRPVVIEAPLHLGEGVDCLSCLSELEGLDVYFVLAYCPWERLVDRIERRNSSKTKKVRRELDWAIMNYNHCFIVSGQDDARAIDAVNGQHVYDFINEHKDKRYKKKRLHIMNETQQETFACFKQGSINFIIPRLPYDLIINTHANNPEQGADHVINFISKNGANGAFSQIQKMYKKLGLAQDAIP